MTSCKPPPTCIDASPIPDANDSRMSAIPYEANLTPMGSSPLRDQPLAALMHALPAPFGRNRKHMRLDPVTSRAQGSGPVRKDLGSAQGAVDHEMDAMVPSFRDQHLYPTPGIRLHGVRRLQGGRARETPIGRVKGPQIRAADDHGRPVRRQGGGDLMQQPGPARARLASEESRRRRGRAAEAFGKIQGRNLVPEEALVVALAQGGWQGLAGHDAPPSTRRPADLLGDREHPTAPPHRSRAVPRWQ